PLEVWDARLVATGEAVGAARAELVGRLEPALAKAYAQIAAGAAPVTVRYDAPWRDDGLRAALARAQQDELRRGVSLVGPHRDDLAITVNGLPARTHASQGEQRSLALALRLAAHDVAPEAPGRPPILLLPHPPPAPPDPGPRRAHDTLATPSRAARAAAARRVPRPHQPVPGRPAGGRPGEHLRALDRHRRRGGGGPLASARTAP